MAEGKRFGEGTMEGLVPTGADLSVEGSSVETDEDIASSEIPSPEEVARKGGRRPIRIPGPTSEEGEPSEVPDAPRAKNRMADIE